MSSLVPGVLSPPGPQWGSNRRRERLKTRRARRSLTSEDPLGRGPNRNLVFGRRGFGLRSGPRVSTRKNCLKERRHQSLKSSASVLSFPLFNPKRGKSQRSRGSVDQSRVDVSGMDTDRLVDERVWNMWPPLSLWEDCPSQFTVPPRSFGTPRQRFRPSTQTDSVYSTPETSRLCRLTFPAHRSSGPGAVPAGRSGEPAH